MAARASSERELEADRDLLTACLDELNSDSATTRSSACQQLGQLGMAQAASALKRVAQKDPEPWIRQAAAQALRNLECPRIDAEALQGLPLSLLSTNDEFDALSAVTNSRGRAVFRNVPRHATCQLEFTRTHEFVPGIRMEGKIIKFPPAQDWDEHALEASQLAAAGPSSETLAAADLPEQFGVSLDKQLPSGGMLYVKVEPGFGHDWRVSFRTNAKEMNQGRVRLIAEAPDGRRTEIGATTLTASKALKQSYVGEISVNTSKLASGTNLHIEAGAVS